MVVKLLRIDQVHDSSQRNPHLCVKTHEIISFILSSHSIYLHSCRYLPANARDCIDCQGLLTRQDILSMKQSGFTLIELLVVIAIIAIIASFSVPSYSAYIAREKVRTAQSDLHLLSLRIEHRYQRVLSYPPSNYDNTASLQSDLPNWRPASNSTTFQFSTENASTTSYTLKATGLTGKFKDCVIAMTHDGEKTISNCTSMAADGEWI